MDLPSSVLLLLNIGHRIRQWSTVPSKWQVFSAPTYRVGLELCRNKRHHFQRRRPIFLIWYIKFMYHYEMFSDIFQSNTTYSCWSNLDCIPYARHYNPLLIWNSSWILTIHNMAIRVVEFSNGGYKIRKVLA